MSKGMTHREWVAKQFQVKILERKLMRWNYDRY